MSRDTKKIIITGAGLLIALAIVALIVFCGESVGNGNNRGAYVGAESIITGAEGYLYYNDENNNIWRRDVGDEQSYMIRENMEVLAAHKDLVLASLDDIIHVIKFDGEPTEESYGVVTENAQLSDEYIYYKNPENGYIVRIDRKTGASEDFINIAVDEFLCHGSKLVFTIADHKKIFVYDMITQIPVAYFGDKDIAAFDVDEDYLVYSDAANGYETAKLNMKTGAEEVFDGVKTKTLEYRNGRVFYVKNHKDSRDSYKLMVNEHDIH